MPQQNPSNRDVMIGLAVIALVAVCITAIVITWLVTK